MRRSYLQNSSACCVEGCHVVSGLSALLLIHGAAWTLRDVRLHLWEQLADIISAL